MFYEIYAELVSAFRAAAEALRQGRRDVPFPAGSFPRSTASPWTTAKRKTERTAPSRLPQQDELQDAAQACSLRRQLWKQAWLVNAQFAVQLS